MVSNRLGFVSRADRSINRGIRRTMWWLAAIVFAFAATPCFALPVITVASRTTTLNSGGAFNFGTVREDRSLVQTFTITNNGDTDLAITSSAVTSVYQIEQLPGSVIKPGKRTTLRVKLPSGTNPGPVAGLLTILSNDPNRATFTLTLNAIVLPVVPNIAVSQSTTEILNGGAFSMGTFESGVPVSRKFTIQNNGNANLTLGNPSISGRGFAMSFPKTRTLRPGKRLTFTVRFTESSAGEFIGRITLPSNDPDTGNFVFSLNAAATPADSRMRVFSQGEAVENGGTVFFGVVRSDRRIDRTITIRNEGRSSLTISNGSITGQGYTLLSQPRSPLGRGKSTKFKVRLTPGTGSVQTGSLSFQTNDPDNAAFTMMFLAGIDAVSPGIQVAGPGGVIPNGGTANFGETNLNQNLQQSFTITNTGTSDLTIGTISVTGAGFELIRGPSGETIAPGRSASTPISIRLFSAAPLMASGQVSFSTTVPEIPTFSFAITGTVRVIPPSPEIEVRETFINQFGATISNVLINNGPPRVFSTNLPAGNTMFRSYIIRNVGNDVLTLGGPTLTNTTGTAFTLLPDMFMLPNMLAAGATAPTFSLQFLPPTPGNYAATLSFMNNDPDDDEGPVFNINVSGTAIASLQAASLRYTGFGGINLPRLPDPLPPPAERPYPFSFGSVPAGATVSSHTVQNNDGLVLTNQGQSPFIFASANFDLFNIWMSEITPMQPPPPIPPIETPPNGQATINVSHIGLSAGPSVGMMTIDIFGAPALQPWRVEFQEWVVDWFAAGGGLGTGPVRALLDFDPDGSGTVFPRLMYAAGDFTTPVGSPRIAVFQGGAWTALAGGGVNTAGGSIRALASYSEPGPAPAALFAAGSFASVGTPAVTANNIARWDGTTWTTLGPTATNGVSGGTVNALAVFPSTGSGSELYAGGSFTNAGLLSGVQGIAKWNGSAWTRLRATDDGVSGGEIRALMVYNDRLYAGGTFPNISSLANAANGIAAWDGSAWSLVGPVANAGVSGGGARVNAMVVFDADGPDGINPPVLVVGGSFTNAASVTNVSNIAQWNGSVWQRLANGIGGGEVFSLAVFDEDSFHPSDNDGNATTQRTMPGRLYAAGNFALQLPTGNFAFNVARWDGVRWGPVGSDTANGTNNGEVLAMRAFDADGLINGSTPNDPAVLFLGGTFTQVQKLDPMNAMFPVNNIAVWGWRAP